MQNGEGRQVISQASATTEVTKQKGQLNTAARADLEWWWQFGRRWNGVAMQVAIDAGLPSAEMMSNVSGMWTVERYLEATGFNLNDRARAAPWPAKELMPIVLAVAVLGRQVGRVGHYGMMRQCGGGSHYQLGYQQGFRGDVPAETPGLPGGEVVVCCTG